MLQWMGGSRRKVTTSRKSVQKRQKQYFEQRRRLQQQQSAGFESSHEDQIYKEQRSLDVLNLLNFATTPQEISKLACPSGREDPKINASTVKNHITMNPPMIQVNKDNPADTFEIKKASSLSANHFETLSPNKVHFHSQENNSNASNEIYTKPDLKTAIQQQLSVFDLLGDDESNGNLLGSPTCEAHVAFSVDGLGKVGTVTPPCSPLQPDRYVSYGCSSPSKAAREVHPSQNLNCGLNDIELEVDAIMQDIEMPQSGRRFEFSTGMNDPHSKMKKILSPVRDPMQLDGWTSKVRGSFSEGKAFCVAENSKEDLWNDRSSLLDAYCLDEKQHDFSWKSWQCHPDGDFSEFLSYKGNKIKDCDFGGSHLQKKRDAPYAAERFCFSDLPASKHRASENDYDFITSQGKSGRHHLEGTSFDFGDVNGNPHWSFLTFEDARESTSLLSEESCSSTAVRGKVNDISLENSRAKRLQSDFGYPTIKHRDKNILDEEKHFKSKDDFRKRNDACWSGQYTQMPDLSESKSARNINYFSQGKIGPHRSWLFEEGYRPTDTNFDFSYLCQTSETKQPSSFSKHFAEDNFDILPVHETYANNKFSSFKSKSCRPFKSSSSGNGISENLVFCQPSCYRQAHDSARDSKAKFWATTRDFDLESRPLHSSQDDASHGGKYVSDLSEQGSITNNEENGSESQEEFHTEKNLKVVEDLESVKHNPDSHGIKDKTVETLSSVKISDKSESSIYLKEHQHGDDLPVLCENGNKETEREGSEEGKICLSSSPKLMMLESYVLQLLCVQKLPNSASV